jgi:oligosaccharide repeat unit polymerase
MIFFSLVFIIFLIFLLPLIFKVEKFSFNVYSVFVVILFFQLIVRNIFIYFNLPNESYIQNEILRGLSLQDFELSGIIFSVCSIFIVISYAISRYTNESGSSLRISFIQSNPSESKILIWSSIFLLFSFFANLFFFSQFDLSLISFYRGVTTNLQEYSAQGYLRLASGMCIITGFIGLAYYWKSLNKFRKQLFLIITFTSFSLAMLNAIFTSSRAIIVTTLIGIFIFSYYSKIKFSLFTKLFVSVILFLILTLMTIYRMAGNKSDLSLDIILEDYISTPFYLIVNQGGIDLIKTQHMVNFVLENSDYKYGELVSNLLLLPIPRSIWQDKPVNVDTQFGMAVYEASSYGAGAVPPGILGEFFWDFSWLGLLVASFITGFLMGFLDRIFHNNKESIFIKVIFSSSLIWTGMSIMGSGFVSFIVGAFYSILPLFLIFFLSNLTTKI